MIPEISFPKNINLESIDLRFLKKLLNTHPQYKHLKWDNKSTAHFISKPVGYATKRQTERRRSLEKLFGKLALRDIFAKDHIEEYLRDQYRRNYSINTLRNSLFVIDSFLTFVKGFGKSSLKVISHKDILAFIEHEQDRGMKPSSVDARVRTLKTFLRFLIEKDCLSPEVLSKRILIKVPDALPRAMAPEDVKKLIGVIDAVRDRAMVLVLLRTGMRIGELLATLIREVNLDERKIEIYEAEKTQVGRVVYLSDDAQAALMSWYEIRDPRKEYLFYAQGRQRMTYATARNMFVKYIEKAGLSGKGYTLHSLRHTCASELLNAGMRLECVQPLLGHSCIEMTRRYARLTDKTREAEYFRAMAIIERGEIDGDYQLDH